MNKKLGYGPDEIFKTRPKDGGGGIMISTIQSR